MSDHDILIVFHSNFFSGLHCFRNYEILLQAGYEVVAIYPIGGASGDFFMTDYEGATMSS